MLQLCSQLGSASLDYPSMRRMHPKDVKYAHIIDGSIMINKEKLLVVLGVPAEHTG